MAMCTDPDHVSAEARRTRRPGAPLVISLLALVIASTSGAYAATGGTFILGRSNSADSVTKLTGTTGTPLSLVAPSGKPPLEVSNAVRVPLLNASSVNGYSAQELRTVTRLSASNGPVAAPFVETYDTMPWHGSGYSGIPFIKRVEGSCITAQFSASNYLYGATNIRVEYFVRVKYGDKTFDTQPVRVMFNQTSVHEMWSGAGSFSEDYKGYVFLSLMVRLVDRPTGARIITDSNDAATIVITESSCL